MLPGCRGQRPPWSTLWLRGLSMVSKKCFLPNVPSPQACSAHRMSSWILFKVKVICTFLVFLSAGRGGKFAFVLSSMFLHVSEKEIAAVDGVSGKTAPTRGGRLCLSSRSALTMCSGPGTPSRTCFLFN